jgi:glycerol-3-phosphate acyltransferase PlsY
MVLNDIQPWLAAILVIGGYLLGSIPFGVIATRMAGLGDIRDIGSGNIGATNVLRTGRKDLAAITLIGDGGKGAVAVGIAHLLALHYAPAAEPLACALGGAAAFLGHLFPVWLRFKGGKGVATCLAVARLLKTSSLSALTAAAVAPLYALALLRPLPTVLLTALLAVLVFIRHHENIGRLLAGTEPKIGAKKTP